MSEKENEQLELLGKHYDVTVRNWHKTWFITLEQKEGIETMFETGSRDTLQAAIDEAMEGVGL